MKWSSFFYALSMIVGVVGMVGIVVGWLVKSNVLGMSGGDLANKGIVMVTTAIWLALMTQIHQLREEQ